MRQSWGTAVLGASLGIGLIMIVLPTVAQACAVCLGSEDPGYFWGMLFLMSMPFIVGSSIGGWLLYSYRRGQAGLALSAPNLIVERRMPHPASTSAVSGRHDDEAQAHCM
jgi:hypothetical protein